MDQILIQIIETISGSGTWVRYFFIFISLILLAYILYRNGSEKVLNNSIENLEKNIQVKDERIVSLIDQIKRIEEFKKSLELECGVLRAKTDLTEVLKMLGNLSETFGREHTSSIEVLQIVIKNIQEQQTVGAKQLEKNNELVSQVFEYVKQTWNDTTLHKRRGRQEAR